MKSIIIKASCESIGSTVVKAERPMAVANKVNSVQLLC